MTTELTTELNRFIPLLESAMRAHLEQQHPRLQEAFCYTTLLGGKRLRPFLVWIIGRYLNVQENYLLTVAAAIELLHTYSLIHDDLPAMDNADFRRGHPTCHLRFTEAQAILTGDGLLTLAFEILSAPQAHEDPSVRCQLVTALAQASGPKGMVAGQWLDMDPLFPSNLPELDELHALKSGALIACSCILPAFMADLSLSERTLWQKFGEKIGLAFQIVDDILDTTGDAQVLGKPTQQDMMAQKKTYSSLLGIEDARQRAEKLVLSAQQDLFSLSQMRRHSQSSSHREEPQRDDDKYYQSVLEQLTTYILTRQL